MGNYYSRSSLIFLFLLGFQINGFGQLIINEVSQGTGFQEYVEFVVTGEPECGADNCVDLRRWIIDDNNGFHSPLEGGYGIAKGCIRFQDIDFWSCIPYGTLIVIYHNGGGKNPQIPADDLSKNDGNCVLIIPGDNSSLLERNADFPTSDAPASSSYDGLTFSSAGDATVIGMGNSGDSFQTINPADLSTSHFAVSYGTNTLNPIIYFAGSASGLVYFMGNFTDDDPFKQSNWASGSVPGSETPGEPNNADNAAWIQFMNNNCQPGGELEIDLQFADVTCNGACNGTALIEPSIGTAPFTYSWGNGLTINNPNNLCPGNYNIKITDSNGCSKDTSLSIAEPVELVISVDAVMITCNGSDNGNASVSATGGTGSYSYSWNSTPPQLSSGAANLSAGTYMVVVTDQNNCPVTEEIVITEPELLSISLDGVDPGCGQSDGSIDASIDGGIIPYTYSWSDNSTTQDLANIPAGTYSILVTDKNGCSMQDSYNLIAPSGFSAEVISKSDISCNGYSDGNAFLEITGGTGPFTYSWIPNVSLGDNAINLSSGMYMVFITDQNQCVDSVSFELFEPAPIIIDAEVLDVSCFGSSNGEINITVSGGNGPYSYFWNTGASSEDLISLDQGEFVVTINDNKNCVKKDTFYITEPLPISSNVTDLSSTCSETGGSASVMIFDGIQPFTYSWVPSGGSSQTVSGLSQGMNYVLYQDANGCTGSDSTLISTGVPLSISAIVKPVQCSDSLNGAITILAFNGSPPYNFIWDPLTSEDSIASDLGPGNYNILITDAAGCFKDTTISLVTPPDILMDLGPDTIICKGTMISLNGNVTGGNGGPYQFTWSTGDTISNIINSIPQESTFFLEARDKNNCIKRDSILIRVFSKIVGEISSGNKDAICQGEKINLVAMADSGKLPYNFLWSTSETNDSIFVQPDSTTTYTVVVQDACNSKDTLYKIIKINSFPDFSITELLIQECPVYIQQFTSSNLGANCTWIFSNGDTLQGCSIQHSFYTGGEFNGKLIVEDGTTGCVDTTLFDSSIVVDPFPVANFNYTPPQVSIINSSINFFDASENAATWQWQFLPDLNSVMEKNPKYTYKDSGTYDVMLIVANEKGCLDTTIKTIRVSDEHLFYIPNAFSPNDDSFNDFFKPEIRGIVLETYSFMIFDRWGEMIFKTNDIEGRWDGKVLGKKNIVQIEVYNWIIRYKDIYGEIYKRLGHVTVIR